MKTLYCPTYNISQFTQMCILANIIMSGSLDWNQDIGTSEDSQASTNPLDIQTYFSFKFICISRNIIVFSCKSQEYFAKSKRQLV